MSRNFHEGYVAEANKPPSERSTGLVFAACALMAAILWRDNPAVLFVALGIAAGFAVVSFLHPSLLKPLNWLWWKFGLLLHRIVSPVVMFLIFALVFVPAGMIMRIWRDPLRSRRTPQTSYWIERKERWDESAFMQNQF